MKHDLLIKLFDFHTKQFIDGYISYDLYMQIEIEYYKRKKLFTICLN